MRGSGNVAVSAASTCRAVFWCSGRSGCACSFAAKACTWVSFAHSNDAFVGTYNVTEGNQGAVRGFAFGLL